MELVTDSPVWACIYPFCGDDWFVVVDMPGATAKSQAEKWQSVQPDKRMIRPIRTQVVSLHTDKGVGPLTQNQY